MSQLFLVSELIVFSAFYPSSSFLVIMVSFDKEKLRLGFSPRVSISNKKYVLET